MPSSSFYLSVLSALSSTAFATQYALKDSYAGSTFLDGFTFFSDADPTNGFVKYQDKTSAQNKQLLRMIGNDNYLGVDYTTPLSVAAGVGRASVRIESTKTYTKGLFILDLKHMPGGVCGTWPAFWSLGSGTWPQNGEIDIIEGVNTNSQNKMVLHTDTQCKTNGVGQLGAQNLYDCALDSASGASGCDVNTIVPNSFGTGFNANGGGVYAMEWTSTSIKTWFFPRGSIPVSITTEAPDTTTFGLPQANFQGACDIETRFKNHKFIFDTTFCGDWAGNVYAQSSCHQYPGLSGMDSCKKFVAENPSVFADAYWQISSFKTYNVAAVVSSSSSSTLVSTSTRASTSTLVTSTRTSTLVSTSTLATSTRTSTPVSSSTLVSSTRTSTAATPTATKKVSTDATCGGTGGFTCQGSAFGNCCSPNGWCGSTAGYCGTGCNAAFGTCSGTVVSSSAIVSSSSRASSVLVVSSTRTSTSAAATATKKVSTDATCGGTKALTCQGSGFGNCCSANGWCGSTAAYCGTGCQKTFGTCT